MKNTVRGILMAGVGILLGTGTLWAHPGHVTEGGVWHTVTHALSSPFHVAVICAVVALAVGGAMAARPVRHVVRDQSEANEVL